MDVSVYFLFDVVVTHLEIFGKEFEEPLELAVTLKFFQRTLKLTSSRLNVGEFVANRELEFSSEPMTLRQNLEDLGISMAVNYQGSTLGTCSVTFPEVFLDKISPTMSDLLHEDTVEVKRRADVVGTLSILLRLTLKCDEVQPTITGSVHQSQMSLGQAAAPEEPKKGSRVIVASQGATINPQDVLFLFGDPDPLLQVPSDPCSNLPSQEGEERLRLDLSRYHNLHNRRVTFPRDDPCPKEKPSLSRLIRLTKEYSQYIDKVAEQVKQMNPPTSSVATPGAASDRTTGVTPRTPKDEPWIPVPLRSESEDLPGVKPIRFCPVCLFPMSWLPKYTPCPRCNTKARPVLPTQDPPPTAEQIVAEQLVRPKVPQGDEEFCWGPCPPFPDKIQNQKSEEDECPAACHCTCADGKVCAHCRIRIMCEDIYQSAAPPEPTFRHPEPRSDEDFCVIAESKDDDLPYLSRVFTELKALYQLHDTKKLKAIQQRCQSQTLLPRRSVKELTQALYEGGRTGAPTYSTYGHHKRTGHKRCLPAESVVSRRHGWNWATSSEARFKGWRPGAILRASGQIMRYFLLRGEARNLCQKITSDEDYRRRMAEPVLNITKRDGEIFVTLRPLPTLDMRQKPITFKIVKSELAMAMRQIKRRLKAQGFQKCTGHHTLMLCTCRDAVEKFELNKALRKECRRHLMQPCPETLVLTDTSISDVEFDLNVTPPAGTRWPRKALRNTVNHSTQTQIPAPQLTPRYPVPDSPYWRAVDCAAGDRYMGTTFGDNMEMVFEDGIFGYRGGGQHGRPSVWRHPLVWNEGGGAPLRMGTARNASDPHRFGKSVWKGLPRKIIRKMRAKSKN